MNKQKTLHGANIKSMFASSLSVLVALSSLNTFAIGAPNSKPLTQAQFVQQRDQYLRFQKYVQVQTARQAQQIQQQKLQQLAKRAAAAAPNTDKPKTPHKHVPIPRQDILLVMPAKGAKAEDIKETIANAQGEICGRLGAGGLGVILVKAQPGKVVQLQRALAADTKDFKHVNFNRPEVGEFIPTTEPTFPKAWHLMRMRICDAWDEVQKTNVFPISVAVFDTGTAGPEPWVNGHGADVTGTVGNKKVDDLGFDFDGFLGTGLFDDDLEEQEKDIIEIGNNIKTLTYGITDQNGHGTWVASAVNGSPYNGMGAAGVNSRVPVFPIKIADGPKGTKPPTDDLALVKAMCVMYDTLGTPIINISFSNMFDAREHPILHEFFKDWYYRKNGLIFVSAGNDGRNLTAVNQPYVICVSAMAHKGGMELKNTGKWKSAYGTPVDFTAPGQDIEVCNQDGTAKTAHGTSLSCPLVAGVASMIWTINQKLKNTEVERILRESCENKDGANTDGSDWNPEFGYGMPDAFKACMAAMKTHPW